MQAGLAECTFLMLSVIRNMYKQEKITIDEFLNYTEMKMSFLSQNIESISSENDKIKANRMLCECASIICEYQYSL